MTEQVCPLCQIAKHMRRTKLLYGTPVCKRCYYKFANRRQLAYIVDAIIWWPITWIVGYGIASLDPAINDFVYFALSWVVFPMIFFCKDSFNGHSHFKEQSGLGSRTKRPGGFC